MNLKSWADFLKEQAALPPMYERTGVACPRCGDEVFRDASKALAAWPPKYNYLCLACGWTDTA